MLAARVEAGKFHPPRGSTEYNTGRFRCPNCGSDDVNYVADTVLCLRCARETERV
jgi:DNA-directed RNA polymerase subunit RPC12/RpoP